MQTTPYDLKPQPRFSTVDAAIRWLVNARPDSPRSVDLSGVSIGFDSSRFSRDETLALRSELLAIVGTLDVEERNALAMRAAGHSYREIGEAIGVQGKAAARRVDAARSRMADRMRAKGLIAREVV
ncbi:hypothetical protein [Vulgatibacter sp.]|uniref:hypothetical protein n=1 Tax=Vulgatibacter sp. TaxID=1971226 RepID=UPI003562460A